MNCIPFLESGATTSVFVAAFRKETREVSRGGVEFSAEQGLGAVVLLPVRMKCKNDHSSIHGIFSRDVVNLIRSNERCRRITYSIVCWQTYIHASTFVPTNRNSESPVSKEGVAETKL